MLFYASLLLVPSDSVLSLLFRSPVFLSLRLDRVKALTGSRTDFSMRGNVHVKCLKVYLIFLERLYIFIQFLLDGIIG